MRIFVGRREERGVGGRLERKLRSVEGNDGMRNVMGVEV